MIIRTDNVGGIAEPDVPAARTTQIHIVNPIALPLISGFP